jgi:diguanylate cyclase (GGDEF)-like protein/PAS domain S-box-containing protein
MNPVLLTKRYMLFVLILGSLCLAFSLYRLPFQNLDLNFLILLLFSIGFGSRITIQIPRFKSYFSFSDTFVFLALLLYGGEAAILLAAVEAFVSSWQFCKKKITVFFNAAAMSLSTMTVALILKLLGVVGGSHAGGITENLDDFLLVLSLMALAQFVSNTGIASIYGALKTEKPFWETWTTQYIWTFVTYSFGAAAAGILLFLTKHIGFSVIIATFPAIYFVYLTYKMYVKNVEMANAQAEQAKGYADALEKQSIALRESEERFRSAFNYAPIGIALVAPTGNWLKVNRALSEILGYSEEEFLAADFQSMIHPEDLGETLVKFHELLSQKIPAWQMEHRYLHKSGRIVWAAWSASTASEAQAEQPSLIFQIQDVTDKKLAEERLQYDATHDALTGLPNRKCFMMRLEQALEKTNENPRHKVSVLFIDLDRFKYVNDSLGHQTGDRLLVGIAKRLRECLRPKDLVARLGGDEFTILVEGNHQAEEVVKISERIQEKFAVPFDLDGHEIYSSASIGILNVSENHKTSEDLMRDADTAMYQAKRGGRARHEVFNENMHTAMKETLKMETELRRAIEKQELEVYYQPIYSLITGNIEGFEALARWNHPEFGMVAPDKFVCLAEEIGIIDALGEQILGKACDQIISLKDKFFDGFLPVLSVNLSCKQFAQPKLVERIECILAETNFPAHRLRLEITESVFFEYKETAIRMLNDLRAIGIEINIDDFGTGYSNLSYLTQLPISTLKIDRSFVSPITTEGNNVEIIQTILALARSLGLKVIAEGVETEEQLDQLKKLNCEGAQGYYFAKPMRFEDIKTFLGEKFSVNITPEFENMPLVSTIQ